jgi:hypothetical protein
LGAAAGVVSNQAFLHPDLCTLDQRRTDSSEPTVELQVAIRQALQ